MLNRISGICGNNVQSIWIIKRPTNNKTKVNSKICK